MSLMGDYRNAKIIQKIQLGEATQGQKSNIYTDRPTEVRPTSLAFLLRFTVPQIGVPYIFGKFRVQRKCLISNIFEKMDFSKGLLMGEKLWSFFKLTMILHSKSPKCGKKWI